MTVDQAIARIDRIVELVLAEYDAKPRLDRDGNPIPHPLSLVTDDDKLFALDVALKDCAIKTVPASLLVAEGSVETELKFVSEDAYVRVPRTPKKGERLDIDEGLAYGVMYMALNYLDSSLTQYKQIANEIYRAYMVAYKETQIKKLLSGGDDMATQPVYFRYSADGVSWHDSYVSGDIYISFKQGDGVWSEAIRFVGKDAAECRFKELLDVPDSYEGMGGKVVAIKTDESGIEFVDMASGGGAGAFTDLADTPADYTDAAGKRLAVNASGDGLEFVEATLKGLADTPADYTGLGGKVLAIKADESGIEAIDASVGGTGVAKFGEYVQTIFGGSGDIVLDTQNYNTFIVSPDADATLKVAVFDDDGDGTADAIGWEGASYRLFVIASGVNVAIDTSLDINGDASIPTDGATMLDLFCDGLGFMVVANVNFPNY